MFTAEIWDVDLNLRNDVTWVAATVAILGATWYLLSVQQLFFPHEERRVIPDRLAIVNLVIFFTMLLAMIGLFLMINVLMLVIEIFVFPQGLIATWPTLEDPHVTLGDKFRLASFISTIGVLSGALGGGLESRDVIRHLALFSTRT